MLVDWKDDAAFLDCSRVVHRVVLGARVVHDWFAGMLAVQCMLFQMALVVHCDDVGQVVAASYLWP